MKILEIKNLTKDFGGLRAVDNLNLSIDEGQILGLIGPNGAGKSTAFNCIAGVYSPSEGEIYFNGEKINNEKPWNLCKRGLARTFQIVKPFSSKSVLYNVMVGSFANTEKRGEAEEKALEILTYLHLEDKKDMSQGRLVEEDQARVGHQRSTDGYHLLLPA